MKTTLYIKTFLFLLCIPVIGCTQVSYTSDLEPGQVRCRIQCKDIDSKSILPSDIENKITSVCLWAYDEQGNLDTQEYFTQDQLSDLKLSLSSDGFHHLYALVNMGPQVGPETEEEVEDYTFRIPSYQEVAENGFPMAGQVVGLSSEDRFCKILVDRLFARITLSMVKGEISPDEISSIKIHQCNMKMKPFSKDGSAATYNVDVSSEEGEELCHSGWENNQFIFYVPENMQGNLLPSNSDQNQKTPENLASHHQGDKIPLCTYIETTVALKNAEKHHGMAGIMKYRFYLGADNTSDFNIIRNHHYLIDFSLTWDGQFFKDNWRVDNHGLSDCRKIVLEGVTGYSVSTEGYKIGHGNCIRIAPACIGGAAVKFTMSLPDTSTPPAESGSSFNSTENLFTLEHYETSDGWMLSPQTQRLLQSKGITWKVQQAVIDYDVRCDAPEHLDGDNQVSFFTEPIFPEYDSELVGEQFQVYLILSVPPYCQEGLTLPIIIQMKDGSASQQINLYINSEDLFYNQSVPEPTTGTSPYLEVGSSNKEIDNIRLWVAEGSKELIQIQAQHDNRYKVLLKKSGLATLHVSAERNGELVNYPDYQFVIFDPILKAEVPQLELGIDGKACRYQTAYYSHDGKTRLSIANSELGADEYSMSPIIYQEQLIPHAEILDQVTMEHDHRPIYCSKRNLRLEDHGEYGDLYLTKAERLGETVSFLKISAPVTSVEPVLLPISIENFLKGFSDKNHYGKYCFSLSSKIYLPESIGKSMEKGTTLRLSPQPMVYDKSRYHIVLEDNADHIETRLDQDDFIEIEYKQEVQSYTSGDIILTAHIYDQHSGKEILSQSVGHFGSYIYTILGAYAQKVAGSNRIQVACTLANHQEDPAFRSLYETLSGKGMLAETQFDNRTAWTPINGLPDCYSYPQINGFGVERKPNHQDDNSYLTLWKEIHPNGQLEEVLYEIIPGKDFLECFRNWENFSDNYTPNLTFHLEGVKELVVSPKKKSIYYYKYTNHSDRDEDGNPFYFICGTNHSFWAYDQFK